LTRVRPLADQAVVLVGASAGIGRATAHELSRRGVRGLVLVGRDESTLAELARELAPTPVVWAAADVADIDAAPRVAAKAAAEFGRLDAWVQLASVATYATVEQTSYADLRRVVEVDLLGAMYGLKAAVPHVRAAGGRRPRQRHVGPRAALGPAAVRVLRGQARHPRLHRVTAARAVRERRPRRRRAPRVDQHAVLRQRQVRLRQAPAVGAAVLRAGVVARAITEVLTSPVREVTVVVPARASRCCSG
jgi:NAD(P)-dependent dehydrogenase (short-subunit alcohol dehydrogenase family)